MYLITRLKVISLFFFLSCIYNYGQESPRFPTGTKWKEVVTELEMPLDTLNGAVDYEISTDVEIFGRIYKRVLKDGEEQDVFLREQDGKVWLMAEDYPEELLLYDFNWITSGSLLMEFLLENDGEQTKEAISYMTTDAYSTIVGERKFSCLSDNSGVIVQDIGRVLDWNRTGCVLGYKQKEPVLPDLLAFKLLWMHRNGEEVFRSENADDFTGMSQSIPATQTKASTSTIYLPSGQRVNATTPSMGIHIIRYSDGTVKKVYTR